jgi:hypothetical protein
LRDDFFQAHAILTMCRANYTLDSGENISKGDAAAWGQKQLPEKFSSTIIRASNYYAGSKLNDFEEALALIEFTVEHARRNLRLG